MCEGDGVLGGSHGQQVSQSLVTNESMSSAFFILGVLSPHTADAQTAGPRPTGRPPVLDTAAQNLF